MYTPAAQYDYDTSLSDEGRGASIYHVKAMCDAIDGVPQGDDIRTKILAGVVADSGKLSCYSFGKLDVVDVYTEWGWQVTYKKQQHTQFHSKLCLQS